MITYSVDHLELDSKECQPKMPEKSLNWYLKTLTFRNEFAIYNWKFSHIPSDLFYFCQWPINPIIFVIYRSLLTIYTTYAFIHSIIGFPDAMLPIRPWPVYLTNWAYLILALTTWCSFVVVLRHYLGVVRDSSCNDDLIGLRIRNSPRVSGMCEVPKLVKLNWFLFEMSSSTAFVVSIVYFTALYPLKKVNYLPVGDIHMHLMNSIIVLIEVSISAIPIRLLHVSYPMCFGVVYSIFTFIYWSLDPPNNVIYPSVVDWKDPLKALLTCLFLVCVLLPVIHLFLHLIFRFRLFVFQCSCHFRAVR